MLMLVREYTPADLDALRRMHASQGFDYPFPDIADPIFVSKLVVEDHDGRAVMASLARLTCEMYLLVDRGDDAREENQRDRDAESEASSRCVRCHDEVSSQDLRRRDEMPSRRARPHDELSSRGPSVAEGSLFDVGSGDPMTEREIPRSARNEKSDSSGREGNRGVRESVGLDRSPHIGPRERYAQLLALHRAGERDLLARGLDDAHAWLPPQVARRFGRRLESLGWIRDNAWTPYCRRLRP